ncbi:hypothetical protein [Methylobacter sp. S3L5C]|uniref:hypothetical protein n=1 Tax=Methylobacter sp. S3L5C TaxID=2839024 RepID=UPI001FAD1E51|nr:hypothetical protein [Methylobacter sp. S3L5C]UOA10266.1 hypothetical protein KKZ03_08555 [Methylobacter sp. S3L5C]
MANHLKSFKATYWNHSLKMEVIKDIFATDINTAQREAFKLDVKALAEVGVFSGVLSLVNVFEITEVVEVVPLYQALLNDMWSKIDAETALFDVEVGRREQPRQGAQLFESLAGVTPAYTAL